MSWIPDEETFEDDFNEDEEEEDEGRPLIIIK